MFRMSLHGPENDKPHRMNLKVNQSLIENEERGILRKSEALQLRDDIRDEKTTAPRMLTIYIGVIIVLVVAQI